MNKQWLRSICILALCFVSINAFAKETATTSAEELNDDNFHIDCFSSAKGLPSSFRFIQVMREESSIGLMQALNETMPQSIEHIGTSISDDSLTPAEFLSSYKLERNKILRVWTQGAVTNDASITTLDGSISTHYQVSLSKCEWGVTYLSFLKKIYLKGGLITNKSVIYSQPNMQFSTKKYLLRNDEVTVTANTKYWLKIRYKPTNTVGWIKMSDVKVKM